MGIDAVVVDARIVRNIFNPLRPDGDRFGNGFGIGFGIEIA